MIPLLGLNIGSPKKNINFPFGTNEELMVLGVPILKPFRVILGGFYQFAIKILTSI